MRQENPEQGAEQPDPYNGPHPAGSSSAPHPQSRPASATGHRERGEHSPHGFSSEKEQPGGLVISATEREIHPSS